jgi:acyl-[acyl-carrier-protein] desaturase
MMDDAALLRELEPTVDRLFDRHLTMAKEWFPHQYVPYGRGRDFDPSTPWDEGSSDLGGASIDEAARSSLVVNLLTEDNLPHYFHSLQVTFGDHRSWSEWLKRWTAEEGRHSMAIYGYLMVTRAVDPVALERARMAQVSAGHIPQPATAPEVLVYIALQELATRIAHHNTGRLLGDEAGYDVMMRVASDENLHHLFYRDVVSAAIEIDPSRLVQAIERQVVGFEMPGAGIPGFASHAAAIARAGIYDLAIHYEQILLPVVGKHWSVADLTGLSDDAERARERLLQRLAKGERVARRFAERREEPSRGSRTRGT